MKVLMYIVLSYTLLQISVFVLDDKLQQNIQVSHIIIDIGSIRKYKATFYRFSFHAILIFLWQIL